MGSSMGRLFRIATFGESHGKALGVVIENCPAGMELTEDDIQPEMDRRRPGQSKIVTQRKESDQVKILSGTFEGKTTGTPIAIAVFNEDQRGKDYSNLAHIFRPSHGDYTYHTRYGHRAYPGGGRASARATIGVVAAGAIAKKILKEKASIEMAAYVSQIYHLSIDPHFHETDISRLKETTEANPVRCPDPVIAEEMTALILQTAKEGDTLGGVINFVAANVPSGLGDPVFDRLDALLASAMMSIPAVKGVEIGSGLSAASMKGTEHNDIFYNDHGKIRTKTNYSGGIQAGISNGENIEMRVAFKPTATLGKEQMTIDDQGNETPLKVRGRHDACVLPRAVPIVEAMAALVLADQFLINKTARYENL